MRIEFYELKGFSVILQFLGRNIKGRYTMLNEVDEEKVIEALKEVYK